MAYYIDLEKVSLKEYKYKLHTAYLPPSRMILKESIDERFSYFENLGIANVKQLFVFLKKKGNIQELEKLDIFSGNYLTILLRELNSTLPKPNKIADFIGVSQDSITKLAKINVNTTEQLFNKVLTKDQRLKLSEETGIDINEILELTVLTDLSRIKWVGATFARMLYQAGMESVEKISLADPIELHTNLQKLNNERKIFKGQIGLNDIRILVNAAKDVTFDIKF